MEMYSTAMQICKYEKNHNVFHHHHHHQVALVARISLTLSRHSSLSFIALSRSSGQHPVSSHRTYLVADIIHSGMICQC